MSLPLKKVSTAWQSPEARFTGNKQIKWIEISNKLEQLLERHQKQSVQSIEHILDVDRVARLEAQQI